MTPAQAERVAVMLQQDRDAVERVARLQAELQRTRANIRTMEMRLHASAQEEATHRNKGNEAVSQAMEAVLTAKSFLDDSGEGGGAGGDGQGAGPPAPVIVATIGNGVPVLDANTAGKMRLWYQAEIDRLTHQVTRLEAELERRDEALDQLRRQVHDLKNGYSTERSELQLRITRGKLELDERVESLSSEHRRKLAAKDEEVKRNIDEMRISTSNQARELVRRTRGMVVCERVVRRLYQRRMWQAWASWVKFAFDHERKQARMRSLLLRMMNGLMHTAWRKWREHVLMEHVARERRHTTLARKQTMSFQKERAIDKLVVTWKKMRLRRFVRAMNLWKAFVVEAQRNQDAIRAHGSLMRRCIRRLTNGRLLAGMNRWKLFVFYCKQAEMGQQIVEMEEKVDQAKKNAQDILENAAAKAEAAMKRRDDAIREERKLQDKLAALVQAKESELVQVQEERRKMTVRIFIRRWRSHGMYKVLSAWKRYTQERKLRRKDKLVADAQNEFTMLHRQLEEARRAVANAGSEKEREIAETEVAALTKLTNEAQARLADTAAKYEQEEAGLQAKMLEERQRSMFERLASAKETEAAKAAAAKEAELSRLAEEQKRALERVVADRERLLKEKEEEMVKKEAEHKRRLFLFAKEQREKHQKTVTEAALKKVDLLMRRVTMGVTWRAWNTWRSFVEESARVERLGVSRISAVRRMVRRWRSRHLANAWSTWRHSIMVNALESSLKFADDANRKRLEAMQAVQQARAQAEWLISAANVAKGETRAHQAQSRTQKQLIEALIAEVKGHQAEVAQLRQALTAANTQVSQLQKQLGITPTGPSAALVAVAAGGAKGAGAGAGAGAGEAGDGAGADSKESKHRHRSKSKDKKHRRGRSKGRHRSKSKGASSKHGRSRSCKHRSKHGAKLLEDADGDHGRSRSRKRDKSKSRSKDKKEKKAKKDKKHRSKSRTHAHGSKHKKDKKSKKHKS